MKKIFFEINLPVSIFKEDEQFIAYTPSLDLSTSGKSYDEVKHRFEEIVHIFFEEITQVSPLNELVSNFSAVSVTLNLKSIEFDSFKTEIDISF